MSEVIVTAERRVEELQHVPTSIVVFTRSDIDAIGAKDFADLAIRTPAVEYDFYPDLGPGTHTNIAIRGIDARDGSATAIYLDDVPLRPDPTGTIGRALPLLADLERVEVLRGPQSTLLGEGAEGGVVRFFSSAPSLTTASTYARADAATTARGSPSFLTIASANAPLIQNVLGLRVSAGYETSGGFIDRVNPFTLEVVDRNVNSITAHTAHLAFAWAPMDELRLTPSFTYQDRDQHDSPSFYVALSDPPGRRAAQRQAPAAADGVDKLMIGALNAIYDFAGLELTSVSSYLHRHVFSITDGTNNAIGWGNPQGPEYPKNDQTYLRETNTLRQTQWGQELRFATPDSHQRVGWLLGAFVLHATYDEETTTNPVDNADGVPVGGGDQTFSGYENHLALFGDLILQLSERLTARVGLRLTHATYSGRYRPRRADTRRCRARSHPPPRASPSPIRQDPRCSTTPPYPPAIASGA